MTITTAYRSLGRTLYRILKRSTTEIRPCLLRRPQGRVVHLHATCDDLWRRNVPYPEYAFTLLDGIRYLSKSRSGSAVNGRIALGSPYRIGISVAVGKHASGPFGL